MYTEIPHTPLTSSSTIHQHHRSRSVTTGSGPHIRRNCHNSFSSAFVPHAYLAYLHILIPLLLLFLAPPGFITLLYINDEIAAPSWLARFSLFSPRFSSQLITVMASLLSAIVRWVLAGAITLFAQKRILQQLRPISEIEALSAFKNFSVIWDWRNRRNTVLLTWLLLVLSGLLTSGFVALISPFPVARHTQLAGNTEVNLAAESESCSAWYEQKFNTLFTPAGDALMCNSSLSYKGFSYSSCSSLSQFESLSAARASILEHFALSTPWNNPSAFVSSFATLNNTRILGSTAGVLPIGPAGVQIFNITEDQQPLLGKNFNYTLKLQGIWVETSCDYRTDSIFNITLEPRANADQLIQYNATCPGAEAQTYTIPVGYLRNGLVVARLCKASQDTYVLHLRSFNQSRGSAHSALDFVQCTLTPVIGDVDAIHHTSLQAFKMNKFKTGSYHITNLTRNIIDWAMSETAEVINNSQTEWSGNMATYMIRWLANAYQGTQDWSRQNKLALELTELALNGLFELHATHWRLILMAKSKSDGALVPSECLRDVKVEVIESIIGWDASWSTILGLFPLAAICIASLAAIISASTSGGRLTFFDPTSPVSLIAATSAGAVSLRSERHLIVGDPEDESVRNTKVSYDYLGDGWGLWSRK